MQFVVYGGQVPTSRDYNVVDLTRGHFPDGGADWNAFLVNENDFSITRHRRDNDGRFAMYDCPRPWLRTRRCAHLTGHDLDMWVDKMSLARNGVPAAVFHSGNCSGRYPQRQT